METTIKQKVGQFFVIGFDGKIVPDAVRELIQDYHVGGIILFVRNIGTPEEVLALTTDLQREAKRAGYTHPLLIGIDQENGVVRRMGEGTTVFPGAMALGAADSVTHAYDIGLATGKELLALGINWNLAPVLDVNVNPANPVIGVRSFGESPEKVANLGKAMMQGMQAAGVIATLKHFPGHGDTAVDSHLALPTVDHSMERLEQVELKPFRACMEAGADMVMTAHIHFPAVEPDAGKPATLSKRVIDGLLRERLNYQGVVTTDCMEMHAISKSIGTEKGSAAALQAGADIVMISHTLKLQTGGLDEAIRAVEAKEWSEEALQAAAGRLQALKDKFLNWEQIALDTDPVVPDIVGSAQHYDLAERVYRDSATQIGNPDVLPLVNSDQQKVLVMEPSNVGGSPAEDKTHGNIQLGTLIQATCAQAEVQFLPDDISAPAMDDLIQLAQAYDTVIVGTLDLAAHPDQRVFIERLADLDVTVVVVAMRSPYDAGDLPAQVTGICTYEFSEQALQAAIDAIWGKVQIAGKLPVTVGKQSIQ
ncbi:beta-N-acetylhexosaminidase [Ornithinibacillus gellani]|uniref:beta-N-acetylhexosaminidase n=1 Tax=Ornithinibacillus gellani TaxID=2293253 RepID=UPI001CC1F847|nr:beta-N-acetylhexosaminidase [Ornithinibacillus gellani]